MCEAFGYWRSCVYFGVKFDVNCTRHSPFNKKLVKFEQRFRHPRAILVELAAQR